MATLRDSQSNIENITNIKEKTVQIAHIESLAYYIAAAEKVSTVNETTAPSLLATLSEGLAKVSSALASASYHSKSAKTDLKKLQGIYYLEKFPEYLQEQQEKGGKIKDTEAAKEHFLNTREEIIVAQKKVAEFEAIHEQLEGWKLNLIMSISAAKAVVYGNRMSDNLSSYAN